MMKKNISIVFALFFCFSLQAFAQIPVKTLVNISKAEDELRFDRVLEDLLKDKNPFVRIRAAVAAGRIGNDAAITALADLLESDKNEKVRAAAASAIGEIESAKGAEAILNVLKKPNLADEIVARSVEAAGKIAAANAKDTNAAALGKAILETLKAEEARGSEQSKMTVLLGITAALRAKPEAADLILAKFLNSSDGRIRADAGNALARLRAKNANEKLRAMLAADNDPDARANAARALGSAEDEGSLALLVAAATSDGDLRVRVNAIRSIGASKDRESGEKLIQNGKKLLDTYKKSKSGNPVGKNELLEIASALGRIYEGSKDEKAAAFLDDLRAASKYMSAETETALAKVLTNDYIEPLFGFSSNTVGGNWRTASAAFQGLGTIASAESENEERYVAQIKLLGVITGWIEKESNAEFIENMNLAIPDLLRAYAEFKTETVSDIYRPMLEFEEDLFIRAAIADILADQPVSKENTEALKKAFAASLESDKDYNDAQLSILTALVKLDKKESFESLRLALTAPDHLVRRHAANLIKQNDSAKDFANIEKIVGTVKPFDAKTGTKLGQILNKSADYNRAVSRKNGTAKAVITTEKGKFSIDLFSEDAPLTVDNFIKLAKSGYFNGVEIHRVVANFVVQDGDPRGDGNGGPGWSIRCEVNTLPYERGSVGMALSGKDTGGSQWFVTHAPQPHLDGSYTVFGKVNETDMKIVDKLTRGDKILKMEIAERKSTAKKK